MEFCGIKTNDAKSTINISRSGNQLKVDYMGISETRTIAKMNNDNARVGVQSNAIDEVRYTNFTQNKCDPIIIEKKWTMSSHLFDASFESPSLSSVTVSNDQNWMAAFVTLKADYADNYTLSAIIKNDNDSFVQSKDVYIGLVPFFTDSNNFVVVYLQWNENATLKSIGCTGMINGVDIGWNDLWEFANVSTSLSQGQKLEITRNDDLLTVTFNGVSTSKRITGLKGLSNLECGVWTLRTTTTFEEFEIKSV